MKTLLTKVNIEISNHQSAADTICSRLYSHFRRPVKTLTTTTLLIFCVNFVFAGKAISPISPEDLISDLGPDNEETVPPLESDTNIQKLFLHFASFTKPMVDGTTLAPVASGTITGTFLQSIDERISAYKLAFPDIQFDRTAIQNELIIETYLKESIGLSITPHQIEQCYSVFLKNTPLSPPPPFSDIRSILQCHALFSLDTVTSLCETARKQEEEQDQKSLSESSRPWNYDEIRINSDPKNCLVTSPYSNECLVTIDDFNHYLKLHSFRRAIRLDTARAMALRGLLIDHYFSELAKKEGLDNDVTSLDKQASWEENRRIAELNPFVAETIQDTAMLKKTYGKYYSRFFSKKIVKTVQIIGSTDSSYIDSLYTNISANTHDSSAPALSRRSQWTFDNNLCWVSCVQSHLSPHIVTVTDTLPMLQCARIKTPFGWFICRIVSIKSKQQRTLKEAKPQLVYLILEEQKRFKGVPDSLRALDYYNNNRKTFVSPDTFLLKTWLAPRHADGFSGLKDWIGRTRRLNEDTVHVGSNTLFSHQLPQNVQQEFLTDTLTKKTSGAIAGPFINDYGCWYFKILKIIPGGISLDFKEIRHQLIDEMQISHLPFDSIRETPTGAKIEAKTALAGLYRNRHYMSLEQSVQALPDSIIRKLCNDQTLKIGLYEKDSFDRQAFGLARQMILDNKNQREFDILESWLRENRVDRQLLFLECASRLPPE